MIRHLRVNLFNSCKWPQIFRMAGAPLLPACFLLAAGCASHSPEPEPPKAGSGIKEYRELARTARTAVQSTMASLATISAQSNGCPPSLVTNFAAEVTRLQVDSVQMRARSQAMQARGDAYFQDWHANMARVKDPDVRALAEKHRPQLMQSFDRIKQLSKEGHEAFRPFLAALRQLRNALELDAKSLPGGQAQSSMRTAKEKGEQVERSLDGIERELDNMLNLITPPGKTL